MVTASVGEGRGAQPLPDAKLSTRFETVNHEKVGGHHADGDFTVRGKEPRDEVQFSTWTDVTLRELTDLARVHILGSLLCFCLSWSTRTFCGYRGVKNLFLTKWEAANCGSEVQISDYLDVAILPISSGFLS